MRRWTRATAAQRLTRRAAGAAVLAAALAGLAALPARAATPAPWHPVTAPWDDGVAVYDIAAAAPWFLAAAGAQGRVAVSTDGGASWELRSPAGQGFPADRLGVAFRDPLHGVVAGASGTLLATSDGGLTWTQPSFVGRPPTVDLNDVALAGSRAAAVGDGGLVIEQATEDAAWRKLDVPATADLTCVALGEDGTLVAGAVDGTVLVRAGSVWTTTRLPGPVTSVTVRPASAGTVRIVASSGHVVVGSADGVAFAPLLSDVYAAVPPWPHVAWAAVPDDELLVAGPAGAASFYAVTPATWTLGDDGLADPRAVAVTPSESVAYVLGVGGHLARTLTSGRLPATLTAGATAITAGQRVALGATVSVAAPGEVVVERRLAGGTVWRRLQSVPWTPSDWRRTLDLEFSPAFTTLYRLRFAYGAQGLVVSTTRRVTVRPKLTPAKLRIVVQRGQTYRFTGSVFPKLRGEKVRLYTDRGGVWRQVRLGGVVRLRDGVRWVSRLFGTPVRETYHLQARVDATVRHGAARSATVTVVVK